MCRDLLHGGRRCSYNGTAHGDAYRNLKAREQYTKRKLANEALPAHKKEKLTAALQQVQEEITALNAPYEEIGAGKHYLMELNYNTEKVLNQLKQDGLTPYIVGGSVRDVLLGLDNKDIDIEVYGGDANQVIASLKKIGNVDEVGKAFGVLKVRLGNDDFDISLPRRDSLVGEGHRGFDVEVDPNMTLEEATGRRDFTINALMYDHEKQYIIDKHNGLHDLTTKTLRHVTDAFDEDPLRVLRGVQMASRFGFRLHPDTIEKAKTLKDQYSHLSVERVQTEFQKLYNKGKASQEGLKILKATGWDENFPGLKEVNDKPLWKKVENMQTILENTPEVKSRKDVFLSASIAHAIADPGVRREFLSATCVGDKVKNEAFLLTEIKAPEKVTSESVKHWSRGLTRGLQIRDWAILQQAYGADTTEVETVAKNAGVWDKFEPDFVSGNDVLELAGKPAGKWVGGVVAEIRAAQYAGVFTDKESGLSWLKKSGLV